MAFDTWVTQSSNETNRNAPVRERDLVEQELENLRETHVVCRATFLGDVLAACVHVHVAC